MPGLNAVPVTEHAVALLLALAGRLPEAPNGFIPGRPGRTRWPLTRLARARAASRSRSACLSSTAAPGSDRTAAKIPRSTPAKARGPPRRGTDPAAQA
jgi:lactate dehydrogenase-like 2-hydroxyacid dehydrogenase